MNNGSMMLLFVAIIMPGALIGIHLIINYNHHPENINMFSLGHKNWRNYDYVQYHLNDKNIHLQSNAK